MRRIVAFACEGATLVGALDDAEGATGVLIVSGGNEVRSGAHRSMVLLARRLAAAGVPVFRFDRRGIGDSEGENRGYAASAPDIAAALAAFRREQPRLDRVVGFGNCDAATALMLLSEGIDALVVANPWLGDESAPPPPAALRAHYARRLRDPGLWRRVFAGGVMAKIAAAAIRAFGGAREQPLSRAVSQALIRRNPTVVLAHGDRTAQIFRASVALPIGIRLETIDTASHSFAGRLDDLARILIDATR